jgi:hypothetical protein
LERLAFDLKIKVINIRTNVKFVFLSSVYDLRLKYLKNFTQIKKLKT